MKLLTKLKKTLGNNQLLATLLAMGTVVILVVPIAVVANKLASNKQQAPAPASETTKLDSTNKALTPATQEQESGTADTNSQEPTTSNKPTTNTSNGTSTPTTNTSNGTSTPTTQQPTSTTPTYTYQKPQCSNNLRTLTINSLKQGYQYQNDRKANELGAWYSNNYQLPSYTHQQYVDRQAENQAWLDNYIAVEIAKENANLDKYYVCTPITRSELGV